MPSAIAVAYAEAVKARAAPKPAILPAVAIAPTALAVTVQSAVPVASVVPGGARSARKQAKRAAKIAKPTVVTVNNPLKPEAVRERAAASFEKVRRRHWSADNETDELVRLRIETLAKARAAFPLVFDLDAPVPLAIGVDVGLRAELGLTPVQCGALLRWWVRSPAYQKALAAPGSRRCSLAGDLVEVVSEQDRARARKMVAQNASRCGLVMKQVVAE
jgi:hypothetical protein